ncbi:PREDICTED: uncharacterized protein K02A2.6-like [Acropora digitifera]|uniref:uncharacterized protein K02A2.6-like n=1 Tax=Acropora digitifera TaxID=70779 RepID=UPI00077B1BF0|nr:PREDICTED: uncharacterized protein K02A2.6-like [Acropora digitifera]
MWCGGQLHKRQLCPAKDVTCNSCHKRGHFQAVCLSKKQVAKRTSINEVADLEEVEVPFLGEICCSEANFWTAIVKVDGHETHFKLDTGAAVSIVSDKEPWQILRGLGGTTLSVVGTFRATLTYKERQTCETVFVLEDQLYSLLRKKACVDLCLIARIGEVNTQPTNFIGAFPQLFSGLGKLETKYQIKLNPNVKPVCLYTPRKIPHPLLPKVKNEIDSMLRQGVISPVTFPTEWCSGIVPVPKPNGRVRICVDLTPLNKAVQRETHPMGSVDESLAMLGESRIFTKLDANSGFLQIPLDDDSKLLTTFISPFARFCFNRLPFGISSAPEIFQRTMSDILGDLDGVICRMDDILIHGRNHVQHDARVRAVLLCLQRAGLTLNIQKCEFLQGRLKFLGHIVDAQGVHADPEKTRAIGHFPTPTTVTELQRFMGMVNQLGKFVPGLADINAPLRQLLRKDSAWYWDEAQQRAFQKVKEKLASPEILAHYNPNRQTVIAADASSTGLGAVLLQKQDNGQRRPICYISRSLSEAERNYAVIEREALASTWACERLEEYVLGLRFTLETDHKPLVPLLTTTDLSKMPPRIVRFRLRMMRYNPEVLHVTGKCQISADALSRAPVSSRNMFIKFIEEVEAFAGSTMDQLPATAQRLQEIIEAQRNDEVCMQVRGYCQTGWPAYMSHQPLLRPYWESRAHLAVVDDLLLYDERIVIPQVFRLDILDCIHRGHLGISKCRARARMSVWWPGLSVAIEDMVKACFTCAKELPEPKEPLMPSSFPSLPWERISMDLFEYKGRRYFITVDCYSRWVEIKLLTTQTAKSVITAAKELFSTHGIPDIVISNNGPCFSALSLQEFAAKYGFLHTTSSPRYPRANVEVERAVRTVKGLLKKNDDPYLALLSYRATPPQTGLSPSELLMGRRLRTQLPVLAKTLAPRDLKREREEVVKKEEIYKFNQRQSFNQRHQAKELPDLTSGDSVWIRDQGCLGKIQEHTQHPRYFIVETEKGTLRRNRSALVKAELPSPSKVDKQTSGDSGWIRDQGCLIQEHTQHPRSFIVETEKGTLRCNRSALVKAELPSPSKVDKQTPFTSTASGHAVQDTEK